MDWRCGVRLGNNFEGNKKMFWKEERCAGDGIKGDKKNM